MQKIPNFTEYIIESEILNADVLNEIGTGTAPIFPFVRSSKSTLENPKYVAYEFFTKEGVKYDVTFFRFSDNLEINFIANGSPTIVVNTDETYRVLSTVVAIIQQYLSTFNKSNSIKHIKIEPSRNYKGDHRRTNIYLEYIKKQLKTAKVEVRPDYANRDVIYIDL